MGGEAHPGLSRGDGLARCRPQSAPLLLQKAADGRVGFETDGSAVCGIRRADIAKASEQALFVGQPGKVRLFVLDNSFEQQPGPGIRLIGGERNALVEQRKASALRCNVDSKNGVEVGSQLRRRDAEARLAIEVE